MRDLLLRKREREAQEAARSVNLTPNEGDYYVRNGSGEVYRFTNGMWLYHLTLREGDSWSVTR